MSQQQQQSQHGRSSSYGSGGWFQGTMEVISGMAPRPSTPQGLPHAPNMVRSLSAPNSPARPGIFPGINRLPSQDSLDRSIHNESGHGKSTAQIIRDLKHSNAQLSAKQASQEAQFMNQLSEVTKSFEDQRFKMDADLRNMKKQLAHLEAYKAAADAKLKEKDAALSKVKEESAFQRHSISDLKNQLYQLQSELDDAHQQEGRIIMSRESQEEMQQLLTDNQEMARELAKLQAELRDSERARHEMERSLGFGKPPAPPSSSGESPGGGYFQKYQETHHELERHRKRLSMTQSRMEGLEAEKQSLEKAHAKTVEELQEELVKQSELFQRREQDLLAQIESLEFTDSQVTMDLKQVLEQRDDTIAEMQEELEQYAEKAADLAAQLAQAQQAAASQENYRRDEAEDLRILHDAQEEEIAKLRKQLEEAQKELELRDEELEESNARLEKAADFTSELAATDDKEFAKLRQDLTEAQSKLKKTEAQVSELRRNNDSHKESAKSLEQELEASRKSLAKIKDDLAKALADGDRQTKELKASVEALNKEKQEESNKVKALEKEKNEAIAKFERTHSEFSTLRNHWENKAGTVNEAESLKKEIEIHKQRVLDASENERVANEKIQELEKKVEDLEKQLEAQTMAASEAKRKLEEHLAKQSQDQNQDEIMSKALQQAEAEVEKLRSLVAQYESGGNKTEKQLREAQIALVALDDEKKAMSQKHRELLMAVEKKKEEIERDSQQKLAAREEEIEILEERLRKAEALESDELAKMRERLSTADSQATEEIKKLRDQLAKARAVEAEKDSLEEKVQSLEATRAVPVTPDHGTTSSSLESATISKLEATISSLTEESDALRTKLKDRDTTIAALVRSSVSMETKIATMESGLHEVRSVQSEEKKVTEEELHELRKTLSAMRDREPKISEEVVALKKELKQAKQDIKRWKRALQEDPADSHQYRYKISILHKELEESVETIKERDQAIENLVNQSISQDAHVKDLKTRLSSLMKEMERNRSYGYNDSTLEAEVDRLQQETEMFAGQIIEQDEEIQNLKRRLQQRDEQLLLLRRELSDLKGRAGTFSSSAMASEDVEKLKKEIGRITTDLKARDEEISYLQRKLEESKRNAETSDPALVSSLQAELDEMKEAHEDNRKELRDLRKQLWEANQAAGEANDLKLELAQAKYALDEYKRKQETAAAGTSEEDKKTIRKLEADLKARTAKIAELEETAAASNEEQVALFQKEINSLTRDLDAKLQDIDQLNESIRSKDAALHKAENIKLKLLGELSDTKDALKKLQGEVTATQRSIESSDGEKDALVNLKNQLAQEREALVSERDDLSKAKDELLDEVSALKQKIESLEEMQGDQNSLKAELEKAKQAREASEKSIVDAYEKQISALIDEQSSLKTALKKLQGEVTATQRSIESSDGEKEALINLKNQLSQEREALLSERDDLSKAKDELLDEVSALKQKIESLEEMQGDQNNLKAELEKAKQAQEASEKSIVDAYEKQISALSDEQSSLKTELEKAKQAREASEKSIVDAYEKRISALSNEQSSLKTELENAKQAREASEKSIFDAYEQRISALSKEQSSLKTEVEKAKQAREASEKSIVDAYEKRISALSYDKDVTIDQLRKDLAESRGKLSEESDEMLRKLKALESENESLREQFDVELHAKNQQIYALEHTLHAQEQIVESMRAEMDQLQSGMERATEKRRGEVEDLQQELVQLEGRSLKQDREITALKMQLEESKLEHKAEVVRLKEALATMEKESPLAKTVAALQNDDRMLEVRERLEQLKARNTALQEENLKLGGRLERKVIEIKSLEYEKTRAAELDHENATLRRQVQELGAILEGGRPRQSRSSSSKSSPPKEALAPPATSTATIDKENEARTKEKSTTKNKKGIKGMFKRRGFSSDDVIQE